jgi:putative peptidoglycan lipid II flippase
MSLARDITTVGGGTLLSRLLAYARDAGIAALLGTGPFSEAFFAILQLINFFRRLLAEGALNSAFVPLWLRLAAAEDGAANANRFTVRTLVTIGCITGIIALGVVALAHPIVAVIVHGFEPGQKQLASLSLVLAAPYIMLAGLIAVMSAALNAERRVIAVTVNTVMFNLVLVVVLALLLVRGNIPPISIGVWLATAIVGAGLIQLLIIGIAWLVSGRRFRRIKQRARDPSGAFFKRALPGLIAAGIPQMKLIAATALVSSSPAAVSWLYYANRLYELPLGVVSVAIAAVIVPRIAAGLHTGDRGAYAQAQSRAYEIALGLALPAATGFALLAPQITGGLFEHGAFGASDTEAVAVALIAICSGLPGHVLEKVFGAVSFANDDTATPMIAALTGLAAAVAGGVLLFPPFGYIGVAAAIAGSGWVGALLLGIVIGRRGWVALDNRGARNLPRIAVATAIMGVAVAAGHHAMTSLAPALPNSTLGRLVLLFILVILGMLIYGTAIDRLGVTRIRGLIAAIRGNG